jgi:hypothetical protein
MKNLSLLLLLAFLFNNPGFAQTPSWIWAKGTGGASVDVANSVSIDASGNVLVTGVFQSPTITFGTTTLTNAGSNDMFIVKYDGSGNVLWAKSAGGAAGELAYGVSLDASGNVYVTGRFGSATVTFGTITLTNAGGSDMFIVKYDGSGNVLWAKSAGGTSVDVANSVCTDASGNVLITGYFQSPTITFGTTTLTNAGSGGPSDIFIVKYDGSGNVLWAKSAGGTGTESGQGVSTDASGNVYVTGDFINPSFTFGTTTLTSAGSNDLFLVKYDSSGNVVWAKSAGGTNGDMAYDVSVDANGNVFVTGSFAFTPITFGTTTLTNAGSGDMFIVKYDGSGNVLWAKSAGGTSPDIAYGVSTDAGGNVYVTGRFVSPTINFGTNTLTNAGSGDMFIVKYDGSGNVLWTKSEGGTASESGSGVSIDPGGNIYVAGNFDGPTITFGTTTLTNAGSSDIFVSKLTQCATAPSQPATVTGPTTPCSGSSQTYSVTAVTGASFYTWTLPSGWTGTSTTISITATAGVTGGNITVAAANACGTSATQTLAVTVSSGPSATITTAGATAFCQGGSVVLNTTTGAGLTYQWKLNGTNITGATNASYTANVAGSYTVVVTSSSCSATSAATTVTVNPLPTATITQAGNVLTAPVGFSTYQWYRNSAIITGATTSTYSATQSGNHYVMVTNSNNCSGQSNAINVVIAGTENITGGNDDLILYPNPNNRIFTIKGNLGDGDDLCMFEIRDLSGRLIMSGHLVTNKGIFYKEVELKNVSTGIYTLKLISKEMITIRSFTIQ